MDILTVIANNHRRPKLCNMRVRVVEWLKMAVNIKELYENSGNRFEKFNTRGNFQKNTLYRIYLVSSCFLCGYFPYPLRFKRYPLSRVYFQARSKRKMTGGAERVAHINSPPLRSLC